MNRAIPLLLLALMAAARAGEPATSRTDVVGQTLNKWVAERSAAGFAALGYENRDAGHSLLPADFYPGLTFLHPAEEDKKAARDKGPAFTLRSTPVIGNCSMAGTADSIGSLARAYLVDEHGQAFLFGQYLHNNLFVYPEHQDHDPGANGMGGGWGDMFPANSPGVLVSQGSSYLDMPFVKALLATAAAFRPEVQEALIRSHILIPTLQAIFRQSNKQVVTEADYFTGKAHPPVFESSRLDELKMITLAHTMTLQTLPPLAFVEVVSERQCIPGIDFFEDTRISSEKLGTTPVNVARVFRGTAEEYVMTVSAARSVDTQKRPLTFRWELLQGNPGLVRIETADSGRKAVLHVRWHPPFTSAAGIRTHRVDIGLFVSNGQSVSAPAILSFYMLPNERRFFDGQKRLVEICYQAGNPELGLPPDDHDLRWLAVLKAFASTDDSLITQLLGTVTSREQRRAFADTALELAPLKAGLDRLAVKPEDKDKADMQRTALGEALAKDLSHALRETAGAALSALADQPDLFLGNQRNIIALAARSSRSTAPQDLNAECERLKGWGVLIENNGRLATAHPAPQWTDADRYYLRQLHLTVLSQVLLPQALERSPAPLFVDSRLASRKPWRDLYHYDKDGKCTGWDRRWQGRAGHFSASGLLVEGEKQAFPVIYRENAGNLGFEVVRSKN